MGRAQLGLVLAPGFGAALAAGRTAALQVIADGSDAASANIALGYASAVAQGYGVEVQARRLRAARARPPPREPGSSASSRASSTTPTSESRWFYVPAVLAMVLLVMTMLLSAMGVVREKEIGTMEQLIVTPIRPWQLLVGKLAPFAIIGIVQVFLVTGGHRLRLRGAVAGVLPRSSSGSAGSSSSAPWGWGSSSPPSSRTSSRP